MKIKAVHRILLIALSVCTWAHSSPDLDRTLAAYVDSVAPGARLGLSVRSTRTGAILHQVAGQEWFVPASTLKLLVTATALESLQLDYEPETVLRLEGIQNGPVFSGVIRIAGRGDPNISGRYFPSPLFPLEGMADSLRARGIDTVRGSIVVDTSFYSGGRRPAGWRRNYFDAWYGAEISPLSFNDNCVLLELIPGDRPGDSAQVRIHPDVGYVQVSNRMETVAGARRSWTYALDSLQPRITLAGKLGNRSGRTSVVLPVRQPAAYFQAAFRKALENRRVAFLADTSVPAGVPADSVRYSAVPLRSLLDEINQRSQNLHAEMLLRNLGQWCWHEGTAAAGLAVERLFLHEAGLPAADFFLVDGSGLSPDNRVKPHAMTALLAYMARQPSRRIYMESMGIPGISGATARRLTGIDAAHRSRFKTGFINGVHALAGYMGTQSGDTLALTILLNGVTKISDQQGRALADTLWGRIASLYNKDYTTVQQAQKLWWEADTLQGLSKRLEYFSGRLENRPYQLGPTGEGWNARLETGPLIELGRFDCVTYMEHVMALATAPDAGQIFDELQRIRYRGGRIDYAERKHYFVEDWIAGNADWVFPLEHSGDSVVERTMDKRKFFAAKGLVYADSNPRTRISFMPLEKAITFAKTPWDQADTVLGVGFVANADNICVTHTGFLIARKGEKPLLRHASQLQKKTTTQPLDEYLQTRRGKSPGVYFFGFREPAP